MSQQDNSQISRKVWDAWNAHDADRYVKLLDEKYVLESDTVPEPVRGRDAARRFMEMYVKAFPDLHFTIDQMISTGDYVVTRYTATGTHRGELTGIPPTNRRVVDWLNRDFRYGPISAPVAASTEQTFPLVNSFSPP